MNYSQIKRRIVNFDDKSWTTGTYGITNEFGIFVIVYADTEQDALAACADSGKMDVNLMSDEDHKEYSENGWEDSFVYAGNACKPFWSEYLGITLIKDRR